MVWMDGALAAVAGRTGGAFTLVGALWLALLVDYWLGEPPVRWHPVVWMGNYLGWTGKRIAPLVDAVHGGRGGMPVLDLVAATAAGTATPPASTHAVSRQQLRPFVAGTLAWCVGAAVVLMAAVALQGFVLDLPAWAAAVVLGLLLKPLLAWRMLRDEVLAVEAALAVSLDAGRARLARLVSRDVTALSEAEVRESAIESLAENLNDSVVAPVFWFVLFGLPGAALYRFANTADAMWGYLGERNGRDWTWAGKWAARADDVLSWAPARLTAALLVLSFPLSRQRENAEGRAAPSLTLLRREAARTPSPNSGWPMATMALLLGVRLGKPGVYILNETARRPLSHDVARTASLGRTCVRVLAVLAAMSIGLLH